MASGFPRRYTASNLDPIQFASNTGSFKASQCLTSVALTRTSSPPSKLFFFYSEAPAVLNRTNCFPGSLSAPFLLRCLFNLSFQSYFLSSLAVKSDTKAAKTAPSSHFNKSLRSTTQGQFELLISPESLDLPLVALYSPVHSSTLFLQVRLSCPSDLSLPFLSLSVS